MKLLPLLMMAFGAMIVGCERHDFEETRRLHDKSAPESTDADTDSHDHADH